MRADFSVRISAKGQNSVPEYGLLPAGRLEDNSDWGHWFGVNAECVLGMTPLAEALQDLGAPKAAHYGEEASAYRRDVRGSAPSPGGPASRQYVRSICADSTLSADPPFRTS
jgi:hypothetical protein